METFETGLISVVSILKLGFESVSVLCILCGLLAFLRKIISQPQYLYRPPFFDLRLILGSWLALALEFQLGADILGTTIAPEFSALGKLGAIAVIRTFLNLFLSKELEVETAWKERIDQKTR